MIKWHNNFTAIFIVLLYSATSSLWANVTYMGKDVAGVALYASKHIEDKSVKQWEISSIDKWVAPIVCENMTTEKLQIVIFFVKDENFSTEEDNLNQQKVFMRQIFYPVIEDKIQILPILENQNDAKEVNIMTFLLDIGFDKKLINDTLKQQFNFPDKQ
jgi:hypothetical protein